MAQQLGDPRSILNVALSSRHRLHVGGVGHNQLKVAFEQIIDRHPEVARGFHGRVGGPVTLEPLHHFHQFAGRGAKALGFAYRFLARFAFQYAGYNKALMHVEARTAAIFNFHGEVFFYQRPRVPEAVCVKNTLTLAFPPRCCLRRFSHCAVHQRPPRRSSPRACRTKRNIGVRPTRGDHTIKSQFSCRVDRLRRACKSKGNNLARRGSVVGANLSASAMNRTPVRANSSNLSFEGPAKSFLCPGGELQPRF